jgi:post-segregation antitoxin (ccd killing protein)
MGKAELRIDIDQALLNEARLLDVDIASITEASLRRALAVRRASSLAPDAKQAEADAWAQENAATLEGYRRRVERDGVFGEDFRTW